MSNVDRFDKDSLYFEWAVRNMEKLGFSYDFKFIKRDGGGKFEIVNIYDKNGNFITNEFSDRGIWRFTEGFLYAVRGYEVYMFNKDVYVHS